MTTITDGSPIESKRFLANFIRCQFHDSDQHKLLFKWKDNSYRSWILKLDSLRPVIKMFGYNDAFMFNNAEHFEELRQSVMLEF
jgi:hypothetical protein